MGKTDEEFHDNNFYRTHVGRFMRTSVLMVTLMLLAVALPTSDMLGGEQSLGTQSN